MVKTPALLVSSILCLAACNSMPAIDVEYDYPGAKTGKSTVLNAKPKEEASIPDAVMTDAMDEKPENVRGGIFNGLFSISSVKPEVKTGFAWPIKDADKYLAEYKEGQAANAVTSLDGKTVEFKVVSEYLSATRENCKKYSVAELIYLACHGINWYPVRSFEE